MKSLSATEKFKTEIAPVYLRRLRNDVMAELPALIEKEDWTELTAEELRAYRDAVLSGNFMAMRRVSWNVGPDKSSKAQRLLEICQEAAVDNRKILVFSFFRDTLKAACELLGSQAIGPLTGSTGTGKRQDLVDRFTKAKNGAALVSQIQVGGTGLNIQAASVIIICEPQIKPSLESQAISRAYRMGQARTVQVHRLLSVNTIDESMVSMLRDKQAEFDTYAAKSAVGEESVKGLSVHAWTKRLVEEEQARLANLKGDGYG